MTTGHWPKLCLLNGVVIFKSFFLNRENQNNMVNMWFV